MVAAVDTMLEHGYAVEDYGKLLSCNLYRVMKQIQDWLA